MGASTKSWGGKDFGCKPSTVIALARAAAKNAGKSLRASKVENGIVIQAQDAE